MIFGKFFYIIGVVRETKDGKGGFFVRKEENVMPKLQGKEIRKFDQVSRMTLPPKHRRGLGDEIIIFRPVHREPCVMLFSTEGWEEFYENLLECFDGAEQAVAERKIANRCDVLIPDKSNRITIGDKFMAYAKLTDEVLAVGVGDRVELWNPATWEEYFGDDEDDDEDDDDSGFFDKVPYSRPRSKR